MLRVNLAGPRRELQGSRIQYGKGLGPNGGAQEAPDGCHVVQALLHSSEAVNLERHQGGDSRGPKARQLTVALGTAVRTGLRGVTQSPQAWVTCVKVRFDALLPSMS